MSVGSSATPMSAHAAKNLPVTISNRATVWSLAAQWSLPFFLPQQTHCNCRQDKQKHKRYQFKHQAKRRCVDKEHTARVHPSDNGKKNDNYNVCDRRVEIGT